MATTSIAPSNNAIREGRTTWQQNSHCILICFMVSVASLQYGLDLSVINSAQALKGFLKVFGFPSPASSTGYGISTSFQQAITSMMNVGVIVGSLLLETVAHHLGRRRDFLVAALACAGANTILVVSTNKGAIIFGRFLFGISNGFYLGFCNIYISEAAPAHLRGALISFQQLTICIGTVIGTVVNNATQHMESRLSYQIPLFVLYAVPVFSVIIAFTVPESPRWLVLKGRVDDARVHLQRLRGSKFPKEVMDAELRTVIDAVKLEQEEESSSIGSKLVALRAMFTPAELRRTLLTIAAGTMHGASGFPFISGYKTYFFQVAGSTEPFLDSIIVTTVSLAGALAGVLLNRFVGRRPLLMFGFGVQSALMLVIGATWAAMPGTVTTGKVVVAMVVLFQCVYSAACGPTAFVVAGELPSNRLRAMTYGLGNGVGFVANFLISFTTPYFINPTALNIGPRVGSIWFASNLISCVFIFFCLPETHRRSLENLDEMFYAKVPARKFKGYVCSGIVQREEDEENEKMATSVQVEDESRR